MAKIISLINQKGGVGKTTTAINIATYLADAGKLVLLVDLDPQGNASSGLGIDIRNLDKGLYHSLIGGEHPRNIIIKSKSSGHDLMPASQDLAGAGIELVHFDNREFKLYDVLRQIRTDYDYIINLPGSKKRKEQSWKKLSVTEWVDWYLDRESQRELVIYNK